MKKVLLFVLSFLALMPFVSAETYDLSEIDVKIDFDKDWLVFTRYNLDDFSYDEEVGSTKENLENFFNQYSAYIDAIPIDTRYELVLRVGNGQTGINNLTNYNDDSLKETAKEMGKKTNSDKYDIYNNGTYKFVTVEYFDSQTNYNIVAYYTVINTKGYTFQIQKEGTITDSDKLEFKEIIDTVKFNINEEESNKEKEEIKENNNSFNWGNIGIGTIVGALAGGIGALSASVFKKKKSNK